MGVNKVKSAVLEKNQKVTIMKMYGQKLWRPAWYRAQRPHLFGAALESAKRTLDPKGILNPGVLLDPLA